MTATTAASQKALLPSTCMCQNPSAAAPIIEVRNWPVDSAGKSTIIGFVTIAGRIATFKISMLKKKALTAVCNLWSLLEFRSQQEL